MFTWLTKKQTLVSQIQLLSHRLEESRQVVLAQRKEINTLKAQVRVLTTKATTPKPKAYKAPGAVPRASVPVSSKVVLQTRGSIITREETTTKRAEDSGSDFLTGALTGLLVSEVFNSGSSSSSSTSSDPSPTATYDSPSSGGGGDFSGGGASGTWD